MADATTTTALAADNPGGNGQTPQNPYTSTPADRWSARTTPQPAEPRPGVIADSAYDALSDDKKSTYARVRRGGTEGGSEWLERSKLEADPADPTKSATTAADPTATAKPTPGEKVKIGDYELSAEDVAALIQQKAQADLRKTQIPATSEAYTAELPKEFKLPPGIEYKFDTTAPAFVDARNWAHAQGFTQQQFSQLLSFHANTQIAEQVMVGNAAKVELEKLGAHATARVTAIDTWLRGICGEEHGRALRTMMLTAKAVEAVEKIMTKFSSQGAMAFRQDGREPPPAGRGPLSSMPDAEYDALSASEKYAIAKRG
jgi:hypothetical protein